MATSITGTSGKLVLLFKQVGGGGLLPPSHALKSNLSQPADLLTGNNVFQEVADWSSSCHSKYPRLPVQTAD